MDFLSNKFSIKWTFHKNKSPPSNYLYNRVVIGRILLQHRILKRPGILAAHRLRHHLLHQIVVALIEVARLPGPQTRLVRTTTTTTTNTTTSYSIISNYFKLFQIVSNYFKLFQIISNYFKLFQIIRKYFKLFYFYSISYHSCHRRGARASTAAA